MIEINEIVRHAGMTIIVVGSERQPVFEEAVQANQDATKMSEIKADFQPVFPEYPAETVSFDTEAAVKAIEGKIFRDKFMNV